MARSKGTKDYTGMKLGRWTVIGEHSIWVSPKGVRRKKWLCRCECGNERAVILSCSAYGSNKSTQCVECANKGFQKYEGYGEIVGSFWYTLNQNAETRNYKVEITPQYAWNLFLKQNRRCALSGIELKLPTKHTEKWHTNASIDRIDSSESYVEGNVQWVDKKINIMKHSFTSSEFVELCSKVALYMNLNLKQEENVINA